MAQPVRRSATATPTSPSTRTSPRSPRPRCPPDALPPGTRALDYLWVYTFLPPVDPDGEQQNAVLTDAPLDDPMVSSAIEILDGRPPVAGEVLIGPKLADDRGLAPGDELTLDRPSGTWMVSGIGRYRDNYWDELLVVPGFDRDRIVPERQQLVQVYDLPDDLDAAGVIAVAGAIGGSSPYEDPYAGFWASSPILGWGWVAGVLSLVAVGIIAAAAFATSARRQMVTVGQLASNGATYGVIRRSLALQGTWTALIGAVAGMGLALGALPFVRRTVTHHMLNHDLPAYVISVRDLAVIAVTAIVAGTVAAAVPARSASRVPVMSALAGRRPQVAPPRWLVPTGLALVAGGLGLLVVAGTGARTDSSNSFVWPLMVVIAAEHAHDAGVIHRDLKPANLMLTDDGTIKLVDFGIAKLFGDSQQTSAGSVLGTADYMAPEQTSNTNITPRTDLYALGNVMYAMLSGRPPFTGKSVTEVIHALKNDRIVPLDLIDPHLPDELVELVHHLLEKDPADRPPTALVVMKRLQSMKAGLQRIVRPNPDDIPTHIPESDPAADTSSNGLAADPANATNEQQADHDRRGTVRSQVDISRPTAATVISRGSSRTVLPDGSVAPPETDPQGREAVTDFHLEEEQAAGSSPFGMAKSKEHGWQHWFAITSMLAVLGVGGALFWFAIQPPSANELYQSAIDGDVASMKTFRRRFPDDSRFDEVQTRHLDTRLQAVLKRLNAQASIGSRRGVLPKKDSSQRRIVAWSNRSNRCKKFSSG